MDKPQPPRQLAFIAILIFVILVMLILGTGILPRAVLNIWEPGPVANGNGVSNQLSGGSAATLSPTSSRSSPILQPFNLGSTPPFFPTGTYHGPVAGTATPTSASIPTLPGVYVPDVVVVKIDPALTGSNLDKCLKAANATIGSQIKQIDVLQLAVPKGEVAESIASLLDCPGVSYAEPDYIVTLADTIPNDPGWVNQYGLTAIHAPEGWDVNTGSSTVTIAIVDSGVDLSHEDLATKIVSGYDFVNGDTSPDDDNGHGTHVAGIAAALTNNNIGVAGVSWGAHIMPVKVLDASGSGSIANVAAGIVWAAQNGAEVINLSLGCGLLTCPTPPQALQDAVDYAYSQGVTLVAAAGNNNSDFVYYPARFPHVVAVAATDSSNTRWSLSNYGPEVDVSAPGVGIYSTFLNSTYRYLDGTSMSTAFVSGLAAILRGLPTYSSPDQIANNLASSALDLGEKGFDNLYGAGLIQMEAAIRLFETTATPTSITPTSTLSSTPTYTPTPTPISSSTSTPTISPTAAFLPGTPAAALVLPATGFTPNRKTILPTHPYAKEFVDLGALWLEIPRLQMEVPIIGVPLINNSWDVSWLGDQAGWLNGTAFPTHAGNSLISAHVTNASGNPGPFVHLDTLVWGDQIIVHAFGQDYIYSVRETGLVAPGAVSSVIRHEDYPWLTLITCKGYDEVTDTYRNRFVVRAVQVEIR